MYWYMLYISTEHHQDQTPHWECPCNGDDTIHLQLSWVVVLFHYPDKECVLIQTVARAHSFFMTLTLPSGTRSLSHVSQCYTSDTTGRWKAHCRSVPLICSVVTLTWIHTATMFRVCVPSATAVCIHLEGGMSQGPQ